MHAIEVQQLWHAYPAPRNSRDAAPAPALQGLSMQVKQGEIYGLLGPNGSGKSTLFAVLSTLLKPSAPEGQDQGHVKVLGYDPLTQADELRRNIAVVFQKPAVDEKLTAIENLLLHGQLCGLNGYRVRRDALELLDRMSLADRAHELVERFSGGMRRRVELAKALLIQPSLLLLDEPSTGLDPAAVIQFWDLLGELRREEDLTLLVTTHHMGEALRCDHLMLIDQGKEVASGTPHELTEQLGGRAVHLIPRPDSSLRELLRQLESAGFLVEPHGHTLRLKSEDPVALLSQIEPLVRDSVQDIRITTPTLEDVFLAHTGHDLGVM